MSSAANHRDRSHRSERLHRSAMQGERNVLIQRSTAARTGGGALVARLRAFRRRIREARQKQTAAESEI